MIKTLKRIEPLQLGKMSAAMYGLMSLLFVPFFMLFALIGALTSNAHHGPGTGIMIGIGIAMAVIMPVTYAVMGFIFGVIGACLYNLLARFIGGIQVEVE